MKENSEPATIHLTLAFGAVYLIWGSSFLGIAVAIKSIPPLVLGSLRSLIAGGLLFLWCYFIQKQRPGLKDWQQNVLIGVLLIFGGNGAIIWVQQYLPSGFVAVAVAGTPIWLTVLDRRNWKVTFSQTLPVIGLIIGFLGVLTLFSFKQPIAMQASKWEPLSFLLLIMGNISWASGTIYSKRIQSSTPLVMRVSIQMISGGLCFLVAGVISGDWTLFFTAPVELQSTIALVYLIVFASLIAYLAYAWLLTVRPAAQVGTFAYVNPVVAVFLGFAFNGEQLTPGTIGALISILLGVILVSMPFPRLLLLRKKQGGLPFHSISKNS